MVWCYLRINGTSDACKDDDDTHQGVMINNGKKWIRLMTQLDTYIHNMNGYNPPRVREGANVFREREREVALVESNEKSSSK